MYVHRYISFESTKPKMQNVCPNVCVFWTVLLLLLCTAIIIHSMPRTESTLFFSSLRFVTIKLKISPTTLCLFFITHRLFNVSFLFRPGRIEMWVKYNFVCLLLLLLPLWLLWLLFGFAGGGVSSTLSFRSRDRPTAIFTMAKSEKLTLYKIYLVAR